MRFLCSYHYLPPFQLAPNPWCLGLWPSFGSSKKGLPWTFLLTLCETLAPGQSFVSGLLIWGPSQGFGCLGSGWDERGQPMALIEGAGGSVCRCLPHLCRLLLSWRSCTLSLTELHHTSIKGMSVSRLILLWSGPVDLAPWLDWDLLRCWGLAGCLLDSHPTPSAYLSLVLWWVTLLPALSQGSRFPFVAELPALAAPWQPETGTKKCSPTEISLSCLFAGCCYPFFSRCP